MQKIIKLSSILALVALAACNTVSGAGQDIQDAGRAVQKGSQEVKQDM